MNLPGAQHRPTTEQLFLDAGAVAPHPGRSTPPPAQSPDRVDLSQPLVDADAIAGLLCVKRKRIYELARRPDDPLPSVRIGRAVRFVRAPGGGVGRASDAALSGHLRRGRR
jgi:hypothetical protein